MWGSLYGAGTGSVIGMVGSAMTGGDIKEGIIFGAATGLVGGGFQGYCSAKSQGLNPWTGSKTARDDGYYTIGMYPNGEVFHRCFYKIGKLPIAH